MDLASRVLRPDDRVRVHGALSSDGAGLRLAPLRADPSGRLVPVDSMAVDLLGEGLRAPGDPVSVAGIWNGSAIAVTRIDSSRGRTEPFRFAPSLGDSIDLDLPHLDALPTRTAVAEHEDAIRGLVDRGLALHSARVRTGAGVVQVVSAVEVEAVEDVLRPLLGESLVIVASPWTRADLDAVEQILADEEEASGLFMSGEGMDPRGRYRASAWVRRITPRLARGLALYPPGIVALDSWLEPVHEVA